LIVVGGGVVGRSICWRASASWQVTLVDPAPGSGASAVAGGMLAPVTEAWHGEEPLLELGAASLDAWPAYADDLASAAGVPAGLRTDGTIVVAADGTDRAELDRLAAFLSRLGREVRPLRPREVRSLEPAVAGPVRGGLSVPDDHAVDNRQLMTALSLATRAVPVVSTPAVAVRGREVSLADGQVLRADVVVLAAGAYSGRLHERLARVVRPVKGEILRLRARPGTVGPPRRTVRALVGGRAVYLVPRDDGGVVLGATQYETGFDTQVTVGGVRDLLADAERVVPEIGEYELVECAAGLRPGTPDNRPVIGWLEDGLLAATGHHRNGILLAPVTVDIVLSALAGGSPPAAVRPARFVEVTL
jgi:glycine oxidase